MISIFLAFASIYLSTSFIFVKELILYVYGSVTQKKSLCQKFGPYALVTGSTSGIGKSIAFELARKGLHLILIGRSTELLQKTVTEIKDQIGKDTKIEIWQFDFSSAKASNEQYDLLRKKIQAFDIGLLVHSAGISYESAQLLEEVPGERIDDMIAINLRSAIRLSQMVLPQMRKKKQGGILFIGSGASVSPSEPLYAAYVATKAGVEKFANSLQVECYGDNILVQCQTPLLITTKLSKIKTPSFTVLSPESYAPSAVKALETANPTLVVSAIRCPSMIHAGLLTIINLLPRQLWSRIRLKQVHWIRTQMLKKKNL